MLVTAKVEFNGTRIGRVESGTIPLAHPQPGKGEYFALLQYKYPMGWEVVKAWPCRLFSYQSPDA